MESPTSPYPPLRDEEEVIELSGTDCAEGLPISCTEVKIVACSKTALDASPESSCASALVQNVTIANQQWDQSYYTGNLVASNKHFFAYAVRGKGGYMVRIIHQPTTSRTLLKGLLAPVADLAFASHFSNMLACIDAAGNLFIWALKATPMEVQATVFLSIEVSETYEQDAVQRLVWGPNVHKSVDEDNPRWYLAVAHGSMAEVYDVDMAHSSQIDASPIQRCTLAHGVSVVHEAHAGNIYDISISPDASVLSTCGEDGRVKFWQVDQGTQLEPHCLHDWDPHDGASVSSVIFCDDHITPGVERSFWRFVITGAERNRVLKVWCTVTWTCLQTVSFEPEADAGVSSSIFGSSVPSLQLSIDPSSSFLILSDTMRKVLYVLHYMDDDTAGSARLSRVAEYVLQQPVLSFSVVRVVTRAAAGSESALAAPTVEKVIHLCCLQPKVIQELLVNVTPSWPGPGGLLMSLTSNDNSVDDGAADEEGALDDQASASLTALSTGDSWDASRLGLLETSSLSAGAAADMSSSLLGPSDLGSFTASSLAAASGSSSLEMHADPMQSPSLMSASTPSQSFVSADSSALLTPAALEQASSESTMADHPLSLPAIPGDRSPGFRAMPTAGADPLLNALDINSSLPMFATATAANGSSSSSDSPTLRQSSMSPTGLLPLIPVPGSQSSGMGLPVRHLNPIGVHGGLHGHATAPHLAAQPLLMRPPLAGSSPLRSLVASASPPSPAEEMPGTASPSSVEPFSTQSPAKSDDDSAEEDVIVVAEQDAESDVQSDEESFERHGSGDPTSEQQRFLEAQLEKVLVQTQAAATITQQSFNSVPPDISMAAAQSSNGAASSGTVGDAMFQLPPSAALIPKPSAQRVPELPAMLQVDGKPPHAENDDSDESACSETSLGLPTDHPASSASASASASAASGAVAGNDSGNEEENGALQAPAGRRRRSRHKRKAHADHTDGSTELPVESTPVVSSASAASLPAADSLAFQQQKQELREVREQLRQLETANTNQAAAMGRLEGALMKLSKDDQLHWSQLQKDRQTDKQRQQSQSNNLPNNISTTLVPRVEKCIRNEVKALPAMQSQLSEIPKQTRDLVFSSLAGQDNALIGGFVSSIKSKAVTDAIGSSVASASTPHVQQAWRSSFENVFLPGVERSFNTMLEQVNTSLQQVTQEYVHQVQAVVQSCRQADEQNAARTVHSVAGVGDKCDRILEQHGRALAALSEQVHAAAKQTATDSMHALAGSLQESLVQQVKAEVAAIGQQQMSALHQLLAAQSPQMLLPPLQQQIGTLSQHVTSQLQQQDTKHTQALAGLSQSMQEMMALLKANPSRQPTPDEKGAEPSADANGRAMVENQLRLLASQSQYQTAFNTALSTSDLAVVSYLCKLVPADSLFQVTPCPLSQQILLSLIQQLSSELNVDLEMKLEYLVGAIAVLDPSQSITSRYGPSIMQRMCANVDAIASSYPSHSTKFHYLKIGARSIK